MQFWELDMDYGYWMMIQRAFKMLIEIEGKVMQKDSPSRLLSEIRTDIN